MDHNSFIVQDTPRLLAFWAQLGRMLDAEGDWCVEYARANELAVVPIDHFNYITRDYVDRIFQSFSSPHRRILCTRAEFLEKSYALVGANFDSFRKGMSHYDTGHLLLLSEDFRWGIIETDEAYDLFLGPRSSFSAFLSVELSVHLSQVRSAVLMRNTSAPASHFYSRIISKYCSSPGASQTGAESRNPVA